MTKIFNRKNVREKRKILRNNMTEAEKILWDQLRKRKFCGLKFRRQYSVGPYIVDFYSADKKLAIEVDGEHHKNADCVSYDEQRNKFLESIGINILRFSNDIVYDDLDKVLLTIRERII